MECNDDERNNNVLQRVKECYEEMNLPFQNENIDRVHTIGAYIGKNTGKNVKSIIVKLKSWKSYQRFYKTRPKYLTNRRRKPGHYLFSASVNLTKRRYLTPTKDKELIDPNKAGLFEGIFFWGVNLIFPSYFKKN